MIKSIALSLIFLGTLAFQVSAQLIIKNNKIPKDLVIKLTLSSTIQFSSEYDLKITSDGKVYIEDRSHNLPSGTNFSTLLGLNLPSNKTKKPKVPKLKDKLSKKQLKQILAEFEKSGFWKITENDQCQTTINHYTTKGISIMLNGKTKKINEINLNCSSNQNSSLKKFLSLYNKIEKELSGVKKIKLME